VTDQTQNMDAQQQAFMDLLEGEYDLKTPRRGDVFEAVIMEIDESDILVDLGTKRDGIVPSSDLRRIDRSYLDKLQVGQSIPVVVIRPESEEGGVLVSLSNGLQQEDWLRAQDMLESGEDIECPVVGTNSGGILVEFGRLRGFVPNSHLTSLPARMRAGNLDQTKEELVGETLTLVVLDVDQRRRRLVLSKRAADRRRREELMTELVPGQRRTGVVRNLVDFGAFVDLGGIDGLIHISELDWQHVNHPRDVLEVGQEVEVEVLNVDLERDRIGLSRKRALPDPWDEMMREIAPGALLQGTISNEVDFGLFVDIGRGIEGLLHTSEIPEGTRDSLDLSRGASVEVRVLEIDAERRRISLALPEQETSTWTFDDEAEPTEFLYG
jgi:small subunit ribosomal protein S1